MPHISLRCLPLLVALMGCKKATSTAAAPSKSPPKPTLQPTAPRDVTQPVDVRLVPVTQAVAVVPDAAVTPPPVAVPSTPKGMRVLLAQAPGNTQGSDTPGYVPITCFDLATHERLATSKCTSLLAPASTASVSSNVQAIVQRTMQAPCEYSAEFESDGWQPGASVQGQDAFALTFNSGDPPAFVVFPSTEMQLFPPVRDDSETESLAAFQGLPEDARNNLQSVLKSDPATPPMLYQSLLLDLDHDGRNERLYAVAFAPADKEAAEAQGNVRALCVSRGNAPASFDCFWSSALRSPGFYGISDVDGDSEQDLVVSLSGEDHVETAVWTYHNNAWNLVGSTVCDANAPGTSVAPMQPSSTEN